MRCVVGLPVSGYTTCAARQEAATGAVRLTANDGHLRLFGDDLGEAGQVKRHDAMEGVIVDPARGLLGNGGNGARLWVPGKGEAGGARWRQ